MCASEAVPNSNPSIQITRSAATPQMEHSRRRSGTTESGVAQAFVRNELDIFAAKRVPGAGREVPEGHSERAADFRFQLMHGASKAVGRQPFCKGRPPQGTRDRPSLGRLSERAARARCRDDDLSFCGIDWRVDHQLPGIGRTGMTSTDLPGKIVK